jgi:hypothetical protein
MIIERLKLPVFGQHVAAVKHRFGLAGHYFQATAGTKK